ncbi:MAG: stage II sporulation protein M [Planctomycetota bacterium]|jgi:uncharacterized membrane protein SpoIIM required for sporulation
MIVSLDKFVARERPTWDELEAILNRIEGAPSWPLDLEQTKRLHYLYERAAASLAKISTFSVDPSLQQSLERLVARAYGAVHGGTQRRGRLRPIKWFLGTFPRTFRRHIKAFQLSLAVTLVGMLFGGLALALDTDAKRVIMPHHLLGDPSDRVATEEEGRQGGAAHGTFAAFLMTHNIKVSVLCFALGLAWGVGTIILLFYNGVILGAVVVDYVLAGESVFLTGWLLPHGSIEIPSILIAGQAGLVLAHALIGRGQRQPMKTRLREILPSVATLLMGLAVLLVWAGIIESFVSQFHKGVLPYWLKIAFGCLQLVLLILLLGVSGRGGDEPLDDTQ